MPPPLMASLVCQWIDSGDADRLLAWQGEEIAARHALAAERLAGIDYRARPGGFFLWLGLPAGLRATQVVEELAGRQVRVTAAEAFCVGSEPAPQAIRVCVSAAHDRDDLVRALDCIRDAVLSPAPVTWQTL